MKSRFFMYVLFSSSLLWANPNAPTEEVLNVPQAPVVGEINPQAAQNVQHPSMYPFPMQPMQPTTQPTQNTAGNATQHNTAAQQNPATNANPAQQPIQQPMYNAYPPAGNYGVGLEKAFAKVSQMYPGAFITDVDYKGFGYEIEINDSLELFFDMNGNLLWQQWD